MGGEEEGGGERKETDGWMKSRNIPDIMLVRGTPFFFTGLGLIHRNSTDRPPSWTDITHIVTLL